MQKHHSEWSVLLVIWFVGFAIGNYIVHRYKRAEPLYYIYVQDTDEEMDNELYIDYEGPYPTREVAENISLGTRFTRFDSVAVIEIRK